MMKRSAYRLLSLTLGFLLADTAVSAENPGAHRHGHAELSFAVEGNRLELLFTSPAFNVVGFEHRARNPGQKQAWQAAGEWFSETSLIDTPVATCTLISSDVHHSGQHHENEGIGDGHGSHGDSHSAIEVTQTLECPGLESASVLMTPLTTRFKRLERLDIQWAGAGISQGATRLRHGDKTIELAR